jgi:hypothetical protein
MLINSLKKNLKLGAYPPRSGDNLALGTPGTGIATVADVVHGRSGWSAPAARPRDRHPTADPEGIVMVPLRNGTVANGVTTVALTARDGFSCVVTTDLAQDG